MKVEKRGYHIASLCKDGIESKHKVHRLVASHFLGDHPEGKRLETKHTGVIHMKAIEIILLVLPAITFKLWRDRNGQIHPDKEGVQLVGIIMLVSSLWIGVASMSWLMIVKALAVSYAGYILLFPPLMNAVLLQKTMNKFTSLKWEWKDVIYCLDHLSDTAIPDKWKLYRAIPWQVRIAIYIVLFGVSIWWFV